MSSASLLITFDPRRLKNPETATSAHDSFLAAHRHAQAQAKANFGRFGSAQRGGDQPVAVVTTPNGRMKGYIGVHRIVWRLA